jgi:hypothetical protein
MGVVTLLKGMESWTQNIGSTRIIFYFENSRKAAACE